ncbi:MAG: 6,7-dimethyl-8-ribityllumazine synthase, partial [Bacteroidota bacterium]
MSTALAHDLSEITYTGEGEHHTDRIVIVVSKWHDDITEPLFIGARDILVKQGVRPENILRYDVPGSFELPMGANIAL